MIYTKKFAELSATDIQLAGGKGASLSEMTKAGISVPPGFVVLSTTFDRFIHDSGLSTHISSILHTVNIDVVSSIDAASEQIQSLILQAELPASIRSEIEVEFDALDANMLLCVRVRQLRMVLIMPGQDNSTHT